MTRNEYVAIRSKILNYCLSGKNYNINDILEEFVEEEEKCKCNKKVTLFNLYLNTEKKPVVLFYRVKHSLYRGYLFEDDTCSLYTNEGKSYSGNCFSLDLDEEYQFYTCKRSVDYKGEFVHLIWEKKKNA